MRKPQWVIDAEQATGLKWDQLSIFDKIQWQKKYPIGHQLLRTPITILTYGRERLDGSGRTNYRPHNSRKR